MASTNRCWCCGDLTRADGYCYLCDGDAGMVSPPHVCERSDRLITDEHGCEPEPFFTPPVKKPIPVKNDEPTRRE